MADSTGRTPAKATAPRAQPSDVTPGGQTPNSEQDIQRTNQDPTQPQQEVSRDVEKAGFHDSLSGRPVDESGNFLDNAIRGQEEAVPAHRIVANAWPTLQDESDEQAREDQEEAEEKASK